MPEQSSVRTAVVVETRCWAAQNAEQPPTIGVLWGESMNLKIQRCVRLVVALSAVPFYGISQPAAAEEELTTLDEVVVTAQKREESLRDVPISVEAVLGDK